MGYSRFKKIRPRARGSALYGLDLLSSSVSPHWTIPWVRDA